MDIPPITVKPGYRPQAEDKTVEADAVEFFLLRQRSDSDRLAMTASLIRSVKSLSLWGIKNANPNSTPEKIRKIVATVFLKEKFFPDLPLHGIDETLWIQDSIALAGKLHLVFEALGIAYYVTGGVASAAFGEPRSTRDLDLVIEITRSDITRLSDALVAEGFYCPDRAIEDIQQGRARVLSVTHTQTLDNADIILNQDSEFDRLKMQRRRKIAVRENIEFWISSPEDIILAKLLWRRRSESEKQWRDVLGVLKVQSERLDYGYLAQWADRLGILEDLDRAFVEAGI